ncbi:DUF406 family protein [Photobacterium galatheae]|uniref:DUF406 family protein n=1 Tax=Photobacterium galatheae TaxID=1654360 RepID=A0A066RTS7_9GAMM|nr:DUF406 family protein [Photobacterium galatheae]KDM90773.1 hypothetical protein EA58_15415 [Photobacterium galatheae]MCM0149898.1 DUF406 family protein [Photobacterium galatheae]
MANLQQTEEPCEACGVVAEIGFLIREGDEVSELTFEGENQAAIEAEFAPFLTLAKSVNQNMQHQTIYRHDGKQMTARLQFECSAEKIIFDLKSRSLNTR